MQLEKHLSLAKEQQLYQLLQKRLDSEGLRSAAAFQFQQGDLPADTDPTAVRTEVLAARQDHLQVQLYARALICQLLLVCASIAMRAHHVLIEQQA